MNALSFIGENGFYPGWAKRASHWIFQRTMVVVGQILGDYTRLSAAEVPSSDQIIVWSPPRRVPLYCYLPSQIYRERERAIDELGLFRLVCYGNSDCCAPKPGSKSGHGLLHKSPISEKGLLPGQCRCYY
jgi:hypothetical protein